MRNAVESWARQNGIAVLWPDDFARAAGNEIPSVLSLAETYDFQKNPCIDYGKFIERIPCFVFRPGSVPETQACVLFLKQQSIPYKVRGAAHSAGGQVLTEGGAVIDMSSLKRIVGDAPEQEEILVESGIWWLELTQSLHKQGRRPLVLTDNLRTSVAGTLAVGGFGDTTHLYGPQIASVSELTLITPDGDRRSLVPSDRLFPYVLAGRGQLGIIAEARIKTIRRTSNLAAIVAQWHSLPDYVEDAIRLIESESFEFSRMRIQFDPASPHRNSVKGVLGNFRDDLPLPDSNREILKHAQLRSWEKFDFFAHYAHDPSESWSLCSPSVELVFPLPEGLKTWETINRDILKSGLHWFLPRGSSVMVLRSDARFPLAPFPASDFCMMIAIRPAMNLIRVGQYLPLLREFQNRALDGGAKVYLMCLEPEHHNFLDLQFGNALSDFIALKHEMDPGNLMNPGLLR